MSWDGQNERKIRTEGKNRKQETANMVSAYQNHMCMERMSKQIEMIEDAEKHKCQHAFATSASFIRQERRSSVAEVSDLAIDFANNTRKVIEFPQ